MDPKKISTKLQHTVLKESVQSGLPAWVLILVMDSVKASLLVGMSQEEIMEEGESQDADATGPSQ